MVECKVNQLLHHYHSPVLSPLHTLFTTASSGDFLWLLVWKDLKITSVNFKRTRIGERNLLQAIAFIDISEKGLKDLDQTKENETKT
ncbi:unnamed protein product [Caretta caretta]